MKKEIKVSLILIILSTLLFGLTTSVSATGLVDITANTTKTNTATINTTATAPTENITQIETPTFSNVTQTVYALKNTNIKESYSTTSQNLGTLLKDESIKRTGISTTGWSRVETSDGKVAYIQSSDLTTTAPSTSAPIQQTNTTNTTSNYNNKTNTLPQAGIGDNTGMYVVIGICVISAIYAYKKIRDYNV